MRQSLRSPLRLRLLVFLAGEKWDEGEGVTSAMGMGEGYGVAGGGGKAVKSFALKAFFSFRPCLRLLFICLLRFPLGVFFFQPLHLCMDLFA